MWTQQKEPEHGAMNGSTRDHQSGVVLVIVLVGLIVLLGCACLTVDVGLLCIRAQTVQDTVDAAALAGASQLPVPGLSAATAEAETYVSANNEGRKASVSITPQDGIVYYAPGEDVPGYGQLGPCVNGIAVTGRAEVDYVFAPIFGLYEDVVVRSATAVRKDPAGDKGCIFAGSDDPEIAVLTYEGSSTYVEGSIHTNSYITLNGIKHVITGAVEYVNDCKIHEDKVDIIGGTFESTVQPYPVDYQWKDFPTDITVNQLTIAADGTLPSGRIHILGDLTVSDRSTTWQNALYKVEGDVTINANKQVFDRITIVAKGTITFNGACERFTPYLDGIALISYATTSGNAITFNGASSNSEGLMFAPNGGLVFNGANQQVQDGSLIANTIKVNGAGLTFIGTVDNPLPGQPGIRLIL